MSGSDGDTCDDWRDEESSLDGDSLPSGSDSGRSFQPNQSRRPGGPLPGRTNNLLTGNPRRDAATCRASSMASTNSTGSYVVSYTTRTDSGVSSISPRVVASRQPTGTPSESSTDPILLRFASNLTSPTRQISNFSIVSTLSLDTIDSRHTSSKSERSNTLEEDDERADTPGTSEADLEDEDFFGFNEASQAPILNRELLLAGLEFPKEFRRPLLSSSANSDGDSHTLNEILELHTNPQARPGAGSWVPSTDTPASSPDPVDIALAPPPGPAYDTFYSSIRPYTREPDIICNNGEAITASFQGQATLTESTCGTITGKSKSNRHAFLLARSSGNQIDAHDKPFQVQCNTCMNLELFRGIPKSKICGVIDCITDSLVAQVYMFHPGFLVSHLSETSLSTFSAQLWAPNTVTQTSEYAVDFSLGFGPHICLHVSPFVPKDKESLRSFRKKEGNDKLDVKDSLPIALNFFSVKLMAETLDAWLGGIVDSRSDLLEYVNFMMERHTGNLSVNILQTVVSWFLGIRSELLESERSILRNALKLLLTTSVLSLVPRVTSLPPSLSAYLSQQSCSAGGPASPSGNAPKLLTRQIKTSTYHLQKELLHALFFELIYPNELAAQVRLSVALIMSFVLELVRHAGREFAKYANKINQAVTVEKQQVEYYERNVERVVFNRIRAGVYDSPSGADARMGELGNRLRDLRSIMKGKGNEDEECRYVSAILTPVLRG